MIHLERLQSWHKTAFDSSQGQNSSHRVCSADKDIGKKNKNCACNLQTLGTLLKCWANTRVVALKCLDATKLLTKSLDPMNFVWDMTSSNIKQTCGAFADPNSSISFVWWSYIVANIAGALSRSVHMNSGRIPMSFCMSSVLPDGENRNMFLKEQPINFIYH